MNFYFCLYSNKKYQKPRKALSNLAKESKIFENTFEYDREWLEKTYFFEKNSDVLGDTSRGDGWWLWKPYVILKTLEKIQDGDVVFYMDSTDTFSPSLKNFLENYFHNNDILLCQIGESPNKNYTRRDTFYYMGCDTEKYWNTIQLEAGIIGVKKTNRTIKIMEEYLNFCSDPRIIKDGPNLCGLPNFPTFIDHRHDQSILSNIKAKYDITASKSIRDHVECNIWESLKYWENLKEFERKLEIMEDRCGDDFDSWKKNYLIHLF
jgi:hypothetical protein